jgi:hypothetical protein
MRITACLGKAALLLAVFSGPGFSAEQGILTFVFGPSSPDAARESAHAAAGMARRWMKNGSGAVELRRAGSADVQRIDAAANPKELEQKVNDTSAAARNTDPPSFLITLDAAAQAAAVQPGTRIVVAVLNSPSFSTAGEQSLQYLAQICQDHGVRVVVLDAGEDDRIAPDAALKALTVKSGGGWVQKPKDLEAQVAMMMPPDDPAATSAPHPAAPAAPTATAVAAPSSSGSIPVHVRFLRTAGTGSTSESIADREADFGATATLMNTSTSPGGYGGIVGGAGSMEVSYWPNDPHAPLQGLVTVESPLEGLKFEADDNASAYQAHARITAIIRNVKGDEIWTGRREVNVRGPLRRLDERRKGSMFFMRSVTVVGQGPFTLEAKVEDLLANTNGTTRMPLRVGRNAPGLVATDALVVRPYVGSEDKFEADQVLSYEGEALSPVLDPVFRAEKPIDLQVYFRIYPDIQGSPLDLSMEVLREGRVIARLSLPFKSALSNSGREGPTSGIGGGSNIVGGQAKEFPYLINMKGAKFPPGEYQGVISIRQGKNVIHRLIAFKVVGDAAASPVEVARGPGAPAAAVDSPDTTPVVLPDIEPATIDSSGLKMRGPDQKQLWDAAAANASHYLNQLPNFRCIQETHRFTASVKTPDRLREADAYRDELIFEDGKERYQRLQGEGPAPDTAPAENKGIWSRNEFASLLGGLFDPNVAASYRWAGRSMTLGVLCQVFEIEVSRAKSNFVLNYGGQVQAVGYTGRVFIDDETGLVRRLTIEGTGLPKEYGLQAPSLSLDYGMVKIGDTDYLLPLRSLLQLRNGKSFVRNETVFRDYRKFQAESQIKFDK